MKIDKQKLAAELRRWERNSSGRPPIHNPRRFHPSPWMYLVVGLGIVSGVMATPAIRGWTRTSEAEFRLQASSLVGDPIVGRASVIDGDTVDIHGVRIRLNGIDAPESWQMCTDRAGAEYRCGKAAAEALDAFLAASRPTSCRKVDTDRNGRVVAICSRANGDDVNRWLVRNGWAFDWPRYSHGRYGADQEAARGNRAGIWQGDFLEPWEARKRRRGG